MPRAVYNPRAYISDMRNVTRGLSSRTKIIEALQEKKLLSSDLAKKTGLSRSAVGYHLSLLRKRKVVVPSRIGRTNSWSLTTYGQERLFN